MAHNDYITIRDAILGKRQISATYDGRRREMCPHVIGTKNGHYRAFFYQFGGDSKSGLAPTGSEDNWRRIDIDKLSDVSVREGEWYTSSNYDPHTQSCVDEIDSYA